MRNQRTEQFPNLLKVQIEIWSLVSQLNTALPLMPPSILSFTFQITANTWQVKEKKMKPREIHAKLKWLAQSQQKNHWPKTRLKLLRCYL